MTATTEEAKPMSCKHTLEHKVVGCASWQIESVTEEKEHTHV
jgi:hypothetical protein